VKTKTKKALVETLQKVKALAQKRASTRAVEARKLTHKRIAIKQTQRVENQLVDVLIPFFVGQGKSMADRLEAMEEKTVRDVLVKEQKGENDGKSQSDISGKEGGQFDVRGVDEALRKIDGEEADKGRIGEGSESVGQETEIGEKYNPYRDPETGRFIPGGGGEEGSSIPSGSEGDTWRMLIDAGLFTQEEAEAAFKEEMENEGDELAPGEEDEDGGAYEPKNEPDLDEYMKNQYPTTDSWLAAGYLTADGSLLDMSLGQGQRVEDHRSIIPSEEAAERWGWPEETYGPRGSRTDRMHEMMARAGAVRVGYYGDGASFDVQSPLTSRQTRSIERFVSDYKPDYISVDVGLGAGNRLESSSFDEPRAFQVIDYIERAYIREQLHGESGVAVEYLFEKTALKYNPYRDPETGR